MRRQIVQTEVRRTAAPSGGSAPADGWTPLALVLTIAAAIGIAVALSVTEIATLSLSGGLQLATAIAAGSVAAVMITEYEWFIVVLLLVRPSLDGLGGEGGVLTPSVVLGVAFLASAIPWLAGQHATGALVRPSRTALAMLALAGAFGVSALGSADRLVTVSTTVRVLAGALMFLVVEQIVHLRPRSSRRLLVAFFASLAAPAAKGALQQLQGETVQNIYNGRAGVKGTFVHPNPYGTFLVLAMLAAIAVLPQARGWARAGLLVVLGTSGPLLLLTYTRIAWVALVIGALYLGARVDRRIFAALGAGLLGVLVLVPSVLARFADLAGSSGAVTTDDPNSASWRLHYWERVLPLGWGRPVIGVGFGMVERLMPEQLPPHNVIVQAFVEGGLVALVALAAVAWSCWRDQRDRWNAARRCRDPRAVALVAAAGAVVLSLVTQVASENLLTETAAVWAVAVVLGVAGGAVRDPSSVFDDRSAPDQEATPSNPRVAATVRSEAVPSP